VKHKKNQRMNTNNMKERCITRAATPSRRTRGGGARERCFVGCSCLGSGFWIRGSEMWADQGGDAVEEHESSESCLDREQTDRETYR